jgi:hypothetical protein
MYTYNYTRELVNGSYNINNPLRLDGEQNQIWLYQEIADAIPTKAFTIKCNCDNDPVKVEISFETELTTEEEAALATVVSNHKNNT